MAQQNIVSARFSVEPTEDDLRVVWFTSDARVPDQLTSMSDYIETCSSFESCTDCIQRFPNEKKILLVLIDQFEYKSDFEKLLQIHSIYTLKKNTDESELIARLHHDIVLTYRNDLSTQNIIYSGDTPNEKCSTSLNH